REGIPPRRGGARKHPQFAVRLLDPTLKALTGEGVTFAVHHDSVLIASGAAVDGWAQFRVPPDGAKEVFVSWSTGPDAAPFGRWIPLESASRLEADPVTRARLAALGYVAQPGDEVDLARMAELYQSDFQLGDDPVEPGNIPDSIKNHLRDAFTNKFE